MPLIVKIGLILPRDTDCCFTRKINYWKKYGFNNIILSRFRIKINKKKKKIYENNRNCETNKINKNVYRCVQVFRERIPRVKILDGFTTSRIS